MAATTVVVVFLCFENVPPLFRMIVMLFPSFSTIHTSSYTSVDCYVLWEKFGGYSTAVEVATSSGINQNGGIVVVFGRGAAKRI